MPDSSIQSILNDIIRQYGVKICDNPQRCAALLKDLCPENRREVNVLVYALREGIPTEILKKTQGATVEMVIGNLATRLVNNRALNDRAAQWAVECWTVALGRLAKNQIHMHNMDSRGHARNPLPPVNSPPVNETSHIENKSVESINSKIVKGLEFVRVPDGEFLYGDGKARIHLSEFWIMKFPVTVLQYRHFCVSTNRKMPEAPNLA